MVKNSKVVFFGSGPVASSSLEMLIKHHCVEAIVTKPSTVKMMKNVSKEIPILAVETKRELDDLIAVSKFESKLGLLIDFGIIVSDKVINSFDLGIVNSHFSVLPEFRGADPITFAILNGCTVTGVSLMLLVEETDEGPLIDYSELTIKKDETGISLTNKLILLSDNLLRQNLDKIFSGQSNAVSQSTTGRAVSYTRKLTKADGLIDWNKPAYQIEGEIRAFLEWPKSRTKLKGVDVIITKATVVEKTLNPGEVEIQKKQIIIGSMKDALKIDNLKPANRKEMSVEAFLAGYKIS